MRTIKRGLPITLAATTAAVVLAGCVGPTTNGSQTATPEPSGEAGGAAAICTQTFQNEEVIFTVSNVIEGFAPLLVAMESGAFKDVGLNVSIEKVPASDSLAAIGQGRFDGQLTSYSAGNLNIVSEGLDMPWVAPFYELDVKGSDVLPGYWASTDLVGTGPTPNLKGLEGQTISSPTAGSGAGGWLLAEAMKKQGADFSKVTFSKASGGDALIGLENGAVGAAWISQPFDAEAAKNPKLRLAATYAPGLNGSALIVGKKMLDRPDVLTKVLQVMAETSKKYLQGNYYENPETVKYLAAALNVEPSKLGGLPLIFDATLDMSGADSYVDGLQTFLHNQGGSLTYADNISANKLVNSTFAEVAASCLS